MNLEMVPRVGVGVLIFNDKNQLLLGQRKNNLGGGDYAPPGGHLEFGESFEQCAVREAKEETGIIIVDPSFFRVTNDIFIDKNKHYISILMQVKMPQDQHPKNMEPHKNEKWEWFDMDNLPENLFLPLKNLMNNKQGSSYNQSDVFNII